MGWTLMLLWAASLAYYLYVRLMFTLKGARTIFFLSLRSRERETEKNLPLSLSSSS